MSKLFFATSQLINDNLTYLKSVYWYRSQFTIKKNVTHLQNTDILYKSKNYLIVNKPYDLMVYNFTKQIASNGKYISSKSKPEASLVNLLRDKFFHLYDPSLTGGFHILHRLDAVTSGCICN